MIRAACLFALVCASPALAVDLALPAAAQKTVERNSGPDVYVAPVGVFAAGRLPTVTLEGDVARSAWRLATPGLTPFQVSRPLRDQLIEAGFEIVLDCASDACGGFDFRFETETLPAPEMYINIRSYQFVTGIRSQGDNVNEAVTLLTSTTSNSAYVQIIHAGDDAPVAAKIQKVEKQTENLPPKPLGDFSEELVTQGHAVLADLDFESSSTKLGAGPFDSLAQLAKFLNGRPDMRVALVGHTDSVGSLDGNITISRQRAQSVKDRLVSAHEVDGRQLDAEGMGYLAPIASNLTPEGRDRNRRVEVVLLGP